MRGRNIREGEGDGEGRESAGGEREGKGREGKGMDGDGNGEGGEGRGRERRLGEHRGGEGRGRGGEGEEGRGADRRGEEEKGVAMLRSNDSRSERLVRDRTLRVVMFGRLWLHRLADRVSNEQDPKLFDFRGIPGTTKRCKSPNTDLGFE